MELGSVTHNLIPSSNPTDDKNDTNAANSWKCTRKGVRTAIEFATLSAITVGVLVWLLMTGRDAPSSWFAIRYMEDDYMMSTPYVFQFLTVLLVIAKDIVMLLLQLCYPGPSSFGRAPQIAATGGCNNNVNVACGVGCSGMMLRSFSPFLLTWLTIGL